MVSVPKSCKTLLFSFSEMESFSADTVIIGLDAGNAAQQVNIPVPEGCTDPLAANFDPTARSDNGSCQYS